MSWPVNKNSEAPHLKRFTTRPESYIPYRAPMDKSLPATPESSNISNAGPSKPSGPPKRPPRVAGDDLTQFLADNREALSAVPGNEREPIAGHGARLLPARPSSSNRSSQHLRPTHNDVKDLSAHKTFRIGLVHASNANRYAPLPPSVRVASLDEFPPRRPATPPFPTASGSMYMNPSAPLVLPLVLDRKPSGLPIESWANPSLNTLPDLPVATPAESDSSNSTIKASAASPDVSRSLVDVSEGSVIYFAPSEQMERLASPELVDVEGSGEGHIPETALPEQPSIPLREGEGAQPTDDEDHDVVPANVLVFGDWRPEEFNYPPSVSTSASQSPASHLSSSKTAQTPGAPLPRYLLERPTMPLYRGTREASGGSGAGEARMISLPEEDETAPSEENARDDDDDDENAPPPPITAEEKPKGWWKW